MRHTARCAAVFVVTLLGLGACSESDEEPTGKATTVAGSSSTGDSSPMGDGSTATGDGSTATAGETDPGEAPTANRTQQADVFDVGVGDCISEFDADRQVSDITKIPCDQTHDQEVFAVFEVPNGEFPGTDAFRAQVTRDCVAAFTTFIGVEHASSTLDIKWLEPTAESWADGDHELVCTVFDPAGPITGTLEGAKR